MTDSKGRLGKKEVCEAFIQKLQTRGSREFQLDEEMIKGIRFHFNSLPSRYAYDVNIDTLDVLNHKKLLEAARADPATISFSVRPVNILLPAGLGVAPGTSVGEPSTLSPPTGSVMTGRPISRRPDSISSSMNQMAFAGSFPRPAFGSSPNLQALAREVEKEADNEVPLHFFEITIASGDRPKLLSQLTKVLSDLGLNIREAHAFNTKDGFGLDVFVCDGWSTQAPDALEDMLSDKLALVASYSAAPEEGSNPSAALDLPPEPHPSEALVASRSQPVSIPGRGAGAEEGALAAAQPTTVSAAQANVPDDWELDPAELTILSKLASGSFGDLYRGVYCGQDVAVKILRDVQDNTSQYQEFLQEVSIMRKVRHKNVVQFIGACTRKPSLCIVFEYMSGGSVYDNLKRGGGMPPGQVLKVATEVGKGMDYLHQRRIIHRDLKAANLLMDENGVVKIADFGVARILTAGVMTAETGTYRWMAPEVIEHKPYDERADVFSFGVLLWELLTGRVPYSELTPLQAAVGVVHKGLRPTIPETCPPALAEIMRACWKQNAAERPTFPQIILMVQKATAELASAQPPSAPGGGRTSLDATGKKTAVKESLLARLGIGK